MKKRLEAELISIAHRILKLKNKSEVDQLYKETQKLYETLTVLKFYQDNFETIKEDIDAEVLDEKLAVQFETQEENEIALEEKPTELETAQEEETIVSEEIEEEVEPVLEEEIEQTVANDDDIDEEEPVFKPVFELAEDDDEENEPEEMAEIKPETKQVALEDLLGENYVDPIFVKPNEVSLFSTESKDNEHISETITENTEVSEPKNSISNNVSGKTMEFGLNDRVAFVNNLFGESNEDFNRVISQLNTFDTLDEAKNFLNEMVIPDYDFWTGKEDYVERFMTIVEKKFA